MFGEGGHVALFVDNVLAQLGASVAQVERLADETPQPHGLQAVDSGSEDVRLDALQLYAQVVSKPLHQPLFQRCLIKRQQRPIRTRILALFLEAGVRFLDNVLEDVVHPLPNCRPLIRSRILRPPRHHHHQLPRNARKRLSTPIRLLDVPPYRLHKLLIAHLPSIFLFRPKHQHPRHRPPRPKHDRLPHQPTLPNPPLNRQRQHLLPIHQRKPIIQPRQILPPPPFRRIRMPRKQIPRPPRIRRIRAIRRAPTRQPLQRHALKHPRRNLIHQHMLRHRRLHAQVRPLVIPLPTHRVHNRPRLRPTASPHQHIE